MAHRLRIGELAAICGVTRDTVRFYERSGLLGEPDRTASRHRVYDTAAVERIRFVRQLQSCGLTIADIHQLMKLGGSDGPLASQRLMRILRSRLEGIEARIARLEGCRSRLIDVMRLCARERSNGYAALARLRVEELTHPGTQPPIFGFGRRGPAVQ